MPDHDAPTGLPVLSDPGIPEDIRLTVTMAGGTPVLDVTLVNAALFARFGSGEILPFLYRPPIDPDDPDAPRPLRRAVLAIIDDKPVPEGLVP